MYVTLFSEMLVEVINGGNMRDVAQNAATLIGMGSLKDLVEKIQ